MKIAIRDVTVRELTGGYKDEGENGVTGYGGKLDIRPPYQREFVYDDKQRVAVIDTVLKGFPLNTMYWSVRDDGTFEIIDGQQRTISLCQFVNGDFAVDGLYFGNMPKDKQLVVLNYALSIFECEGTDSERLDWFRVINIAGEKLTDQELRNAVYAGPWLSDAKRYFSRTNCPAYHIAKDYLRGSPIRQDFLETAIKWASVGDIEGYMAKHQQDSTALALWQHFQAVITFATGTFTYRKEMKGVDWGSLYRGHGSRALNPKDIEKEIVRLMMDDDVTSKRGIYHYVLNGDDKHLNIRRFTPSQRRKVYEKQKGICPSCSNHFEFDQMDADHITPWSKGGRTSVDNCQMLCRGCNRKKGSK